MENSSYFIVKDLPNPLNKQELKELIEKSNKGDKKATEEIVLKNMRFIIYFVKQNYSNTPYEVSDLISVGTIGLLKAIKTYNDNKNNSFIAYASKCINNEILMVLRKKQVRTSSLNSIISNDQNTEKINFVYDETNFENILEEKDILEFIYKYIDKLSSSDKKIITMYFGLFGEKRYTQYEISNCINLSQSFVCKQVKKILNQLRSFVLEDDEFKQKKIIRRTKKEL